MGALDDKVMPMNLSLPTPPKWTQQCLAAIFLFALTLAMLYYAGKEWGSLGLLRHFLLTTGVLVYVILIFLVSYDAEIRDAPVWGVSLLCIVLGPLGAAIWLMIRPPLPADSTHEPPHEC